MNKVQLNNFDFLRFFAATSVLIKHSYDLIGKTGEQDFLYYLTHVVDFGVPVFFIISGYLIYQSAIRSSSIADYLKKRVLRIFPGLAVSIAVTTLLIGPLFTKLQIRDYFINENTWLSFWSISLYKLHIKLPGVFENNVAQGTNGSLWTLKYEFTFYILVLFLSLLPAVRYRYILLAVLLSFLALLAILGPKWDYLNYSSVLLLYHNIKYFFEWGYYFLSGVVMYLYRDEFEKHKIKINGLMFIFSMIMFTSTSLANPIYHLLLPLAIITIANYRCFFNHFGRYGDFSYGIYIYAFPIQQCILDVYGTQISIVKMICMSFALSFLFAFLSWHLVEKQFMKLKPGRATVK